MQQVIVWGQAEKETERGRAARSGVSVSEVTLGGIPCAFFGFQRSSCWCHYNTTEGAAQGGSQ